MTASRYVWSGSSAGLLFGIVERLTGSLLSKACGRMRNARRCISQTCIEEGAQCKRDLGDVFEAGRKDVFFEKKEAKNSYYLCRNPLGDI
jgi:hypothetical protein